jgi:hypothetical protein
MSLLNRIGLIFNCAAGFLLAPHIIGEERLRRAEDYLETRLTKIKALMKPWQIRAFIESKNSIASMEFWLILILVCVFIYQSSIKPEKDNPILVIPKPYYYLIFIIFVVFWLAHIAYAHVWPSYSHLSLRKRLLTTGYMTLIAPFIIGLYTTISLIFLILGNVGRLLLILSVSVVWQVIEFASRKLVGEGRVKTMMISTGVILLILGTLFQLVATF